MQDLFDRLVSVMRDLEIRMASLDELGALADLRASWSSGADVAADSQFVREFSEWFATQLQHRRFWIAWRRAVDGTERAIGMVNMLVFTRMPAKGTAAGAWGYLGNMFVRECERNSGVGAELLAALLDYADDNSLVRVVLNPSERSRSFYARHGFTPAEDGLLIRSG